MSDSNPLAPHRPVSDKKMLWKRKVDGNDFQKILNSRHLSKLNIKDSIVITFHSFTLVLTRKST